MSPPVVPQQVIELPPAPLPLSPPASDIATRTDELLVPEPPVLDLPVMESRPLPSAPSADLESFKAISHKASSSPTMSLPAPAVPIGRFRLPAVTQQATKRPARLPVPDTNELQKAPVGWDIWQGTPTTEPVDFKPWHPPALLPELPHDELLESRRRALPFDTAIQQVGFEQTTSADRQAFRSLRLSRSSLLRR